MFAKYKNAILLRNVSVILILFNLLYFYIPIRPIVWRLLFVALALTTTFLPTNKRTSMEKSITLFIGLNVLYFFVSYMWLTPSTTLLGNILFGLSSFLMFAYLGRCGVLTPKFFLLTTGLFLFASVLNFQNYSLAASNSAVDFNEDYFTNNASVLFLYLLPCLIFVKNNVVRLIMLLICMFFLIAGVKRGNILAAIIPIFLILIDTYKSTKKSTWKTLWVIISVCVIAFLAKKWILDNEYFLLRFEDTIEGGSSNRDQLYAAAWSLWRDSHSLVEIMFGHGFDGTITHMPGNLRAHNDWLEILVNYGLLGVVMYFLIFVGFIKSMIKSSSEKTRIVLLSVILIWIFKSCYSMGFSDEYIALLAIPVGAALFDDKSSTKSNIL